MSKTHQIVLGEDGRLRIPKAVRQQLGLHPGTKLLLETNGNREIHLRVAGEEDPIVNNGGLLVIRSEVLGDIVNAVEQEREARMDYILTGIVR